MRYCSKRFTVYYYPCHWIQYQSCTHSSPSQLPGQHSGQGAISGAHTCHIKQKIMFASYQAPIYTTEWRAAMWIKCLAEGQKCQALMENEPATLWSRVKGSIQYTTAPPLHTFRVCDCVCVYSCWLYLLVRSLKFTQSRQGDNMSLQNLTKSLIHCNWLICLCILPAAGDLRPYSRKKP